MTGVQTCALPILVSGQGADLVINYRTTDFVPVVKGVPDSDVTVEYCARRNWIVGSPQTVAEKIETIYREVGGLGVLLVFGFDYKHKPEAWEHSLSLLKYEVLPKLKHLDVGLGKAA